MKETAWLFHGGRILDAPRAGSRKAPKDEAVLVQGEVIQAVGTLDRLRKLAPRGTRSVNLEGGTLTPGFVDAHIHLLTWIRAVSDVWIEAQTPEGLERAVQASLTHAKEGDWITLRGWVPREWSPDLRSLATLDRFLRDRPLVLLAVDGHSAWGNTLAIQKAGLGPHTTDPPAAPWNATGPAP